MIVLNNTNAKLFGFIKIAKHLAYEPIEIKGELWILPNEAETEILKRGIINYEKREILEPEYLPPKLL